MLRDKIVFGTKLSKDTENLIKERDGLTLQKAVDIARTEKVISMVGFVQ